MIAVKEFAYNPPEYYIMKGEDKHLFDGGEISNRLIVASRIQMDKE